MDWYFSICYFNVNIVGWLTGISLSLCGNNKQTQQSNKVLT